MAVKLRDPKIRPTASKPVTLTSLGTKWPADSKARIAPHAVALFWQSSAVHVPQSVFIRANPWIKIIKSLDQPHPLQLRQHIWALRPRRNLLVHVPDHAVLIDDDRHPRGHLVGGAHRAEFQADVAGGIRQERERQVQVLGKGLLALGAVRRVDRNAPHLHPISLEFRVGISERRQLIGAIEGKATRKKGDDEDFLAPEIREPVLTPLASEASRSGAGSPGDKSPEAVKTGAGGTVCATAKEPSESATATVSSFRQKLFMMRVPVWRNGARYSGSNLPLLG